MSSWKVISFDLVAERRDFAPEHADESERDFNPNYSAYLDRFEERYDDPDFEFPHDRLPRLLIEEHGAIEVGQGKNEVYALMSDSTNCERVLEATSHLWDQACIVRANDTSDVGTARVYSRVPDSPEADPVEGFEQVDEYEETQQRDGTRVGEKAAAYVSFNHGFTAKARTPLGKDYDGFTAVQHEIRHRVLVADPTGPVGETRDYHGRDKPVSTDYLETDLLFKDEGNALEKAAKLGEELDLETRVEPVPVDVNDITDAVSEEFDPTRYPCYESLMSEDETVEYWSHD